MSGPKTVSYTVDSDAIRRQAQEREDEEAQRERQARQAAREAERRRIEEERRQRQEQQRQALEVGEIKWRTKDIHGRLAALKDEVVRLQGLFPGRLELSLQVAAPPPGDNLNQLQRYVSDNSALIQSVEQQLAQKRPAFEAELATRSLADAMGRHSSGVARSAQDVLQPLVKSSLPNEKRAKSTLDPLAVLRSQASESVKRFLEQEKTPLPAELERILGDLLDAFDERQASGLALELNLVLEGLRQQLAAEKMEARQLLGKLPQTSHTSIVEIRQRLQGVCQGSDHLTQELRDAVHEALQAVESEERQIREAVSAIVHEALENLGYEVEPIESTLFVEGGTVHFRKAGWDDGYFVRLRVDGKTDQMNFNMVQVLEEINASRDSERDIKMENAWCSDLPQVQAVFKDRGIDTKIERHLAAGALPVQMVDNQAINAGFWRECAAKKKQSIQPAKPMQLRHSNKKE